MDSIGASVLPFLTVVLLLIAIILAFDCLWRTERALAHFIRLFAMLSGVGVVKAVVSVLNILSTEQESMLFAVADAVSALLFLVAALLLFRVIRSLQRPPP